MNRHLTVFSIFIILITGVWIVTYAYQKYKSYAYSFLQPIVYHIVFFNLTVFLIYISMYFDINLGKGYLSNTFPILYKIGDLFIYFCLIGMIYTMLKIVLGFQEKELSLQNKRIFFAAMTFLVFCYGIREVLLYQNVSLTLLDFIYNYIYDNIILLEMIFLIALLIYGKKCRDREKAKIINSFGYLFLSRYVFLSVVFPMPWLIRISLFIGTLLFMNLIPFLWFKYFFLEYAKHMVSVIEDKSVLKPIFEKYKISKREQEILALILDGKSNKEIEDNLFISFHTVKNHIYNLYQKLGVKSRYQLIHFVANFQNR